jgi:ABC-2 type transport system ATP-binding protein
VIDQPTATLRRATVADAERIAALFTEEGYPSGPSDIVARLERFSSAMSTVHVAEHEGEVLGFIAVHLVPRFEHDDRFARIVALVVEAGVRERGIGHLLAEAERIARRGCRLHRDHGGHHRPEARRLYEAVGHDGSVAVPSQATVSRGGPAPVIRVQRRPQSTATSEGSTASPVRGPPGRGLPPRPERGRQDPIVGCSGLRAPTPAASRCSSTRPATGSPQERIGVTLQTAALYPKLTVVEVLDLFRSFYRRSLPTEQLIGFSDLDERRRAQTGAVGRPAAAPLDRLALVNDPEVVSTTDDRPRPAARRSLGTHHESRRAGKTILPRPTTLEALLSKGGASGAPDPDFQGQVDDLVNTRFKTRTVRFDRIEGIGDDVLAALPGVESMTHDEGATLLYTQDVAATIGALLAAADRLGVEPNNLGIRRPSLEDVFLDLTGRALRD